MELDDNFVVVNILWWRDKKRFVKYAAKKGFESVLLFTDPAATDMSVIGFSFTLSDVVKIAEILSESIGGFEIRKFIVRLDDDGNKSWSEHAPSPQVYFAK